MSDLLMLLLVVVLFAALALLARLCEAVRP
jgi:hypothetical protein